ncbi:hypothetical protein ACIQCR_19925 [Streptomyces sp. NPDC093249]
MLCAVLRRTAFLSTWCAPAAVAPVLPLVRIRTGPVTPRPFSS